MDLLASYDDDTTEDNSVNASPKQAQSTNNASTVLENEWLSFEQMIAPGGMTGSTEPVNKSSYLVDGVVAYPGMKTASNDMSNIAPVVQSSESSSSGDESETATTTRILSVPNEAGADDDDDAFLKMRKQVKERARSSSSNRSSDSSASSSRSGSPEKGSPSPPHLSPVNSVKSHESDPPNLVHTQQVEEVEAVAEKLEKRKEKEEKKVETSKSTEQSSHSGDPKRSKERKRSHRERSKSKHRERDHGSSKSKKHRSRSRDRKHHHSSRHRHKDKKRHSSRDRKRSKSRDRKRSKSRDRKNSRSEDAEKRRSRSRDRKDKKKERKRSRSRHRSRSKDRRRERSKDRKRRDRSRSKHRSSRSRSRERLRSRSPVLGRKLTFKEQMRKDILTASKVISHDKEEDIPIRRPGEPLKPSDLLKGVRISAGESVTPQMALMQTMAAMHKKAQELTGVEVPKYYNPAAVNPLKYAEQVQKRKLLWSKKEDNNKQKEKDEQIETQWKSAFMSDEDSKTASKFRKLMGMKQGEGEEVVKEDLSKLSEEQRRKQSELFERLDQEYQFARMTTHTQRGVGLGFSSQVYDPNHPSNPPT